MRSFRSVTRKVNNLLLTCEHGSRRIPRRYNRLGLSKRELDGAKDLHDIGSLSLMQEMARQLRASYLYAMQSRLVIDCNRQINGTKKAKNTFHASALKQTLLTEIDGKEVIIPVPGNACKSKKEEKSRFDHFARPYQEHGRMIAEKVCAIHGHAFVIQIHSFYPFYNGEERTTDIGILFNQSLHRAHQLINVLRKRTSLCIDANKPWNFRSPDVQGGAFYPLERKHDIDIIVIEVNMKHLSSHAKQKKIAQLLCRSISEAFDLTDDHS